MAPVLDVWAGLADTPGLAIGVELGAVTEVTVGDGLGEDNVGVHAAATMRAAMQRCLMRPSIFLDTRITRQRCRG